MTFRKMTYAALLTTGTAMAAHATSAAGDVKAEHNAFDQSADAEFSVDVNSAVLSADGVTTAGDFKNLDQIDIEADANRDVSTMDEVTDQSAESAGYLQRSGEGSDDELGVILQAAELGTEVRTNRGEVIGNVIGTRDAGEDGYLIFVDVAADADLPAEQIGFTADVLQANMAGNGLTYESTMDVLRENVRDHMGG